MPTQIWLAVTSVTITIATGLGMIAYKDISRRLVKLEKQDSKLYAAVMAILVAKSDDPSALAIALHGLLINGIERTS